MANSLQVTGENSIITTHCYNNIVTIYGRHSQREKVIDRLTEILPKAERSANAFAKKAGNHNLRVLGIFNNIAVGYSVIKNREKAIQQLRRSLAYAEQQYGRQSNLAQRQVYKLGLALEFRTNDKNLTEAQELLNEYLSHCKKNNIEDKTVVLAKSSLRSAGFVKTLNALNPMKVIPFKFRADLEKPAK